MLFGIVNGCIVSCLFSSPLMHGRWMHHLVKDSNIALGTVPKKTSTYLFEDNGHLRLNHSKLFIEDIIHPLSRHSCKPCNDKHSGCLKDKLHLTLQSSITLALLMKSNCGTSHFYLTLSPQFYLWNPSLHPCCFIHKYI